MVYIFADDLGWGSVRFNGQQQIQTPTLDSLAAAGMSFDNSACTVCAPSRAMLHTGFHQGHAVFDRNGAIGSGFRDADVITAEVLALADYTSAVFGKWGFGANGTRNIGVTADPLPKITSPTVCRTTTALASSTAISTTAPPTTTTTVVCGRQTRLRQTA